MMSWGGAQAPMWGAAVAWVAMLIVLSLLLGGLYALVRSSTSRPDFRPDPGPSARGAQFGSAAAEDPVQILREHYARGEIEIAEFEQRIAGLLRTEPGQPHIRDLGTPGPQDGSPIP